MRTCSKENVLSYNCVQFGYKPMLMYVKTATAAVTAVHRLSEPVPWVRQRGQMDLDQSVPQTRTMSICNLWSGFYKVF